ncbi:MAG: hypothetical protein IH945_04085, partial [Armatimonadetes bacterium]|nr:hypothetical protein [Armatimonadota bacterium]
MSYQNRTNQPDPYRSESRKSAVWLIVGAFILASLGGFALGAGGVLGMGSGSGSGDVAFVGADGGDPLAQSLGDGGSPSTLLGGGLGQPLTQQVAKGRAPAAQRLGNGYQPPRLQSGFDPNPPATQQFDRMPADVRAWLEHLERTEDERVRLSKKQLGDMMAQMMGMAMGGSAVRDQLAELSGEEPKGAGQNYDPSQRSQVESDTQDLRRSWRELNTYFNSAQPPRECVPIKNAYEQCLGETSAMMLDIMGALEESHGDPTGAIGTLMQMMGTSEAKIDVAAKLSDRQVR